MERSGIAPFANASAEKGGHDIAFFSCNFSTGQTLGESI